MSLLYRCGNCRFFYPPSKEGKQGRCKRHAPRTRILIQNNIPEWFVEDAPWLDPADWCGEYEEGVYRDPVLEARDE